MVEPPGQPFVRAVFEIDDRVLVPVELLPVERVPGPVHRRRIPDLRSGMDLCRVKLSENGRRRNAVETIAVIKYAKFHIGNADILVRRISGRDGVYTQNIQD